MKKTFSLIALCAALFLAGAENRLVDLPSNHVLKGVPNRVFITWRSKIVPAKPNTWYRATADIKNQLTTNRGRLRFRVRQIRPRRPGDHDDSIVFSNIVFLEPCVLDYTTHSNIFMTKENCIKLQMYMILDNATGQVQFKNVKLEELSPAEADKIMAARRVEPAFFSPPVYAYAGENYLPWGFRVSKFFVDPAKLPKKIAIEFPELKLKAVKDNVPYDTHFNTKIFFKKPLAAGKYKVIMTAFDKNNRQVLREETFLKVIKRPDYGKRLPVKTVSIDADGNTIINGKKRFINGMYHLYNEKEIRELSHYGFNAIEAWMPTPAQFKKILDFCSKHNVYGNAVLKHIKGEKLAALMAAIKDHPAVVSWDVVDEPSIRNITPADIAPCVNSVRALNTGKPLRISFANAGAIPDYKNMCDIVAAHKYVLPFAGLAAQGEYTRIVVRNFPLPRKHSPQMTLQSWIHWHDETRRPQSSAQTRSLAYISIVNGAKGLWWYSFRDINSWDSRWVPSLWTTFKGLNAELFELESVILAERTMLTSAPATVESAIFTNGKRTVVIAVNTEKKSVSATIRGVKGKLLTELFADGATCPVKNGSAKITIPGETTRIFEVK